MHSLRLIALSLTCALAICGCAKSGNVRVIPVCPKLAPVPAQLMTPPDNGMRTRQILFESPTKPTQK